jgi:hypothetical protein
LPRAVSGTTRMLRHLRFGHMMRMFLTGFIASSPKSARPVQARRCSSCYRLAGGDGLDVGIPGGRGRGERRGCRGGFGRSLRAGALPLLSRDVLWRAGGAAAQAWLPGARRARWVARKAGGGRQEG